MKKGFTLPEILVAVLIIAVLAAMAVPQYEKATEKSRKAEVLATLKKLHESKIRMMDTVEISSFDDSFGIANLDFSLPCSNNPTGTDFKCITSDFTYCLRPNSSNADEKEAVCARRNGGDYVGTDFIYYGENQANADKRFVCKSASGSDDTCAVYGMLNTADKPACGC